MIKGKELISFSADTIIGGLYNYLVNANTDNFQPINANFGILNPINMRDKQQRNIEYRLRSLKEIDKIQKELENNC